MILVSRLSYLFLKKMLHTQLNKKYKTWIQSTGSATIWHPWSSLEVLGLDSTTF